MAAPRPEDALPAIDAKITEIERKVEELQRAAELLPLYRERLQALRITRAVMNGENPESSGSVVLTPETGSMRITGGQVRLQFTPGSVGAIAVEVLKEAGHPLHVRDLVTRINAKGKRADKATIVGALSRYVTEGKMRRITPGTYALAE